MVYSAPYLWSVGHFVTAADLNQQIYNYNLGSAVYLMSVTGDTLYATGANTPARLAIGAANSVMASTGSAPNWVTALVLTAIDVGAAATWAVSAPTVRISDAAVGLFIGMRDTNVGDTDARDWRFRSLSGVFQLDCVNAAASTANPVWSVNRSGVTVQSFVVAPAIDGQKGIRASGDTMTTLTGAGVEIVYTGGVGYVTSYDRTGVVNMPLRFRGSTIGLTGDIVSAVLFDHNTYDIGTSLTVKAPKTVYAGTSVVTVTVTATNLGGTLTTASQPNITTLGAASVAFGGAITGVTVYGTSGANPYIQGGATSFRILNNAQDTNNVVFADAGNVTFRSGSVLSGITTVTATNLGGTLTTAAQPNITSINSSSLAIGPTTTFALGVKNTGTFVVSNVPMSFYDTASVLQSSANDMRGWVNDQDFVISTIVVPRASRVWVDGGALTLLSGGTCTESSLIHLASIPSGAATNRYISTDVAGCYLTTGGVWTDASHEFTDTGERWKVPVNESIDALGLLRAIKIHRYDLTEQVVPEDRHGYIGPFAEELHDLNPLLCRDGRGVSGTQLASFAILASQSQQEKIDALENELADLRELITNRR